jgi:hypothetical protein
MNTSLSNADAQQQHPGTGYAPQPFYYMPQQSLGRSEDALHAAMAPQGALTASTQPGSAQRWMSGPPGLAPSGASSQGMPYYPMFGLMPGMMHSLHAWGASGPQSMYSGAALKAVPRASPDSGALCVCQRVAAQTLS